MSEKDILRLILGFGTVGIVKLLEEEPQYYDGGEGLVFTLVLVALCIFGAVMLLSVGLKGLPDALARKASRGKVSSGSPFSSEALDYFETHPYETTFTDSHGHSWDNTDF